VVGVDGAVVGQRINSEGVKKLKITKIRQRNLLNINGQILRS
jgi:hypothetical protein